VILFKPKPPETLGEAMRIREETMQLFSRAMMETSQAELGYLIECVKHRLDLLPLIRHHFDAEIQREMNRCRPIALEDVCADHKREMAARVECGSQPLRKEERYG
jgi:hypothetical protein